MKSLAGIILALTFAGCSKQLPTYRYRITVEVETPAGLRSGSSVVEVSTVRGSGFPGPEAGGIATRVRGEAVVIDLGKRRTLFALLSYPDNAGYADGLAPTVLLPTLVDKKGTAEAWGHNLRALKTVQGRRRVPRNHLPLLVTFRDMNNPATVQQVAPERLDSAFGPDIRLGGVFVEITDADVTEGIAKRLPWWSTYLERHFDGSSSAYEDLTTNELAARLSTRNFSTEL